MPARTQIHTHATLNETLDIADVLDSRACAHISNDDITCIIPSDGDKSHEIIKLAKLKGAYLAPTRRQPRHMASKQNCTEETRP